MKLKMGAVGEEGVTDQRVSGLKEGKRKDGGRRARRNKRRDPRADGVFLRRVQTPLGRQRGARFGAGSGLDCRLTRDEAHAARR